MLDTNRQGIAASLPRGFDADRFSRLLLTAANTNPALFDCDPTSFLAAGVAAAQLGLEPNDARGLAYLIPFSDRKRGKVVQLIIGYRGLMDLARRSGMVTAINAFPVFESDEFTYTLGLEPTLHHVPGDHDEDAAKLTHVYATARVMGDPQFVVMTRRQIEKVRLGSSGGRSDYSPWATHYTEMALKTAIRRLCKWLPQTVEVAQALAHEERPLTLADMAPGAVVAEYDRDDYIDVDTTTGELLPGAVTE
jgi:recombination protein RecT